MPSIIAAQVIVAHHVAMKHLLEQFNDLEKPIRAKFEADRKPIYDEYRRRCQELIDKKDLQLKAIALEGVKND